MADCCLIKKVATVEVYENKNEVRAYGFMAGDRNTPVMEVRFKHLWGESNLSSCKLRWIIVDDVGSLLVGEVPIQSDNTALINLPNELFTGDRRMKVQLTVASCDGERILNLQQFTDLKVINSLAPNEVVEPVYQILINQLYDETQKYLSQLDTLYTSQYGSLENLYLSAKASLEQYLVTAENGGNAEFLQGYAPHNFKKTEDTIASLKASSKYKLGDVVELLGYYTKGDGAHHKRIASAVDDGSGEQGQNGIWWCVVHSGEVNVSWFGAKGDGVADDFDAIQKAVNFHKKIKIPKGDFLVKKTIVIGQQIEIVGEGGNAYRPQTQITAKTSDLGENTAIFRCLEVGTMGSAVFISGIRFFGDTKIDYTQLDTSVDSGIIGVDCSGIKNGVVFRDCTFRGLKRGVYANATVGYTDGISFKDCFFTSNYLAIEAYTTTAVSIDTTYIYHCFDWFKGNFVRIVGSSLGNSSFSSEISGVHAKDIYIQGCFVEGGNNRLNISGGTEENPHTLVAISNYMGVLYSKADASTKHCCYYGSHSNTTFIGNHFIKFVRLEDHEQNVDWNTVTFKMINNYIGTFAFSASRSDNPQKDCPNYSCDNDFNTITAKSIDTSFVSKEGISVKSPVRINGLSTYNFGNKLKIRNVTGSGGRSQFLKLKVVSYNNGAGANVNYTKEFDLLFGYYNWSIDSVDSRDTIKVSLTQISGEECNLEFSKGDEHLGSDNGMKIYIMSLSAGLSVEVPTTFALDSEWFKLKMQQEGIYEEYVTYRDELHEYENSQTGDETMLLPVLQEPVIPESVREFAEKYKLI